MKNTAKILLIALVAVLALAGCKKKENAAASPGKIHEVKVDLSTLPLTINPQEFTKSWEDLAIVFPPWDENIDWSYLTRVRIKAKYYWDDMEEIDPSDGLGMVTLVYDVNGDWRGPEMGPGPNTPLKQMNVGGASGTIHTDRGSRMFLDRAPGMILFQNSNVNVSFIEVTEITFFRRPAEE